MVEVVAGHSGDAGEGVVVGEGGGRGCCCEGCGLELPAGLFGFWHAEVEWYAVGCYAFVVIWTTCSL